MPAENAHLGQAEHNVKLYETLDRKTYSDWAATVLFYAALHYVDAYLVCTMGIHPNGHADRDNYLNKMADLKGVRSDYRDLKDCCHNARYSPPTRFSADALAEMRDELSAVISAISPHLTPPPTAP